jgi:hypothetical protein
MKYRMLALAAVAAIAPSHSAKGQTPDKYFYLACDINRYRVIEDAVDPVRSHATELARRIRRDFRGVEKIDFQGYENSAPPRFDCTMTLAYKFDTVLDGSFDAGIARLIELRAAREVFGGYVNSLKVSMRREVCDGIGYEVRNGDAGNMPILEANGTANAEVMYKTLICTKELWREYFP